MVTLAPLIGAELSVMLIEPSGLLQVWPRCIHSVLPLDPSDGKWPMSRMNGEPSSGVPSGPASSRNTNKNPLTEFGPK
jgi:hypothetical protein